MKYKKNRDLRYKKLSKWIDIQVVLSVSEREQRVIQHWNLKEYRSRNDTEWGGLCEGCELENGTWDESWLLRRELEKKVVEKCVLWIMKCFRWNNVIFKNKNLFNVGWVIWIVWNIISFIVNCFHFKKFVQFALVFDIFHLQVLKLLCLFLELFDCYILSSIFLNSSAVLWFFFFSKTSNLLFLPVRRSWLGLPLCSDTYYFKESNLKWCKFLWKALQIQE